MRDRTDTDAVRRIEVAVACLPKKQRDVFLAHRLVDMPYEEIACRTGLSVRQVERHMAKAIYKLAKQLDGRELSWWERWF